MAGVRAVAFAISLTTVANLPLWLLSGLAPQIATSLRFGEAVLGAAVAVFYGFTALTSMLCGRLVDRIGWRRGMVLAALVTIVSLVGMGAVNGLVGLFALLLVGSLGFSLAQPCANLALARVVDVRRQGTAFGIKQSSLPLTSLLVGSSVPLFTGPGGWRWAFVAAAVLVGVLLVVVARDLIRHREPSALPIRQALRRRQTSARESRRLPPALIMLAVAAGFAAATTISLGGFIVVYGVAAGFTPTQAGQILAIASVGCLAGRVLSGYVVDRRGRGRLPLVAMMMLGGCVGHSLLASGGRGWTVVLGAILAFGLGWAWNGVFAFAVVYHHSEYPATATGVIQTAMGTGGAVGPLLFGLVVDGYGYGPAWAGTATALAIAAVCVMLSRRLIARRGRPA